MKTISMVSAPQKSQPEYDTERPRAKNRYASMIGYVDIWAVFAIITAAFRSPAATAKDSESMNYLRTTTTMEVSMNLTGSVVERVKLSKPRSGR